MAKQGQHKHDKHDQRLMPAAGHNNPRQSQPITTGTYKKRSTYRKQAVEHKDPNKQAQMAKNGWDPDTTHYVTHEADSQARAADGEARSGSDSNASSATRGH